MCSQDNEGHSGGQVNRQAEGPVVGHSSNSPYRCHLCRSNRREDKDHGAYVHAADWDFSPQVITGYVSNKGMHALAAVLRVGFDHVHCCRGEVTSIHAALFIELQEWKCSIADTTTNLQDVHGVLLFQPLGNKNALK